MIRNSDIQFRPPAEIRAFQEERIRETVAYLSAHSPFYRKRFAETGLDPASVRTIDDLQRLPVTTKTDLQRDSEAFVCVPKSRVVDYVTTSGTLGDPVTLTLTDEDLDRLAYNEALSFSTAGLTPDDILQMMVTIDRRFMAGLAYFMGARALGCGVVRVGNGIPELQWDTIRRIAPTACIVIPSFLLKLMDYAEAHGIDYRSTPLRRAVCIGEALRNGDGSLNTLGARIRSRWPGLQLHSTYASTEMQTSFTECGCFCGGHLPPDLIVVELLGENDRPAAPGEPGEVTVTTLGVTGMPLLRFKTGDICRGTEEPCACGRNTLRLSPVLGRKGQMIKYKGTTLYPPAIFDVLNDIPEIENYVVEVYANELGTDDISIRVCGNDRSDAFVKHVKDLFRSRIRVAPELVFESPQSIAATQMPPVSRKPTKFVYLDKRNPH